MFKFKKGDTIKVTSGKDRGREGKIEKTFPQESKILVLGVNVYKKHIKATVAADKKGGIYDIARPLDVAKVALLCPHCKKVTRAGFKTVDDKKSRVCKKCDRFLDIK